MKAEILNISYSIWKSIVQANNFTAYFHPDEVEEPEQGTGYAGTNEYIYMTRIVDETWADFNVNFPISDPPNPTLDRQIVSRGGDAIASIVGLSNIPKRKLNAHGIPLITTTPPEGARLIIPSINWCERRTWYPESVEVLDETLADSGDGITFNPADSRVWIDVSHGRITSEKILRPTYRPIIEVDGDPVVENSPDQTDNDYTIDYLTGSVTFNISQSGKTVVAKKYYYENGSAFWLIPDAGKEIRITTVELQFGLDDIEITSTAIFQLYVGGFPYGPSMDYQTMYDYINDSSESYVTIPAMGGNGWRGMSGPVQIFRWPYDDIGTTDLKSSLAMSVKVSLENDIPLGGSYAIATFYGRSESE